MAKLCKKCETKQYDKSVRGTCLAPNNVPPANLPQGHQPWTDSPSFTLCETCAEKFELCQWCWGPLNGWYGFSVPTDKQFCRQFDSDNGKHVEGMYIGEQILVQMTIDLFSGKRWYVRQLSRGVRVYGQRLVTEGGRYGTHEIYFDLTEADPKALIELVESSWSGGGSTWRVTVEVKH